MIRNFEDFCRELNTCGFSMGGGNAKGIFALIDYDWLNQDMLDTPVKWHCGDPEVDPWEWRMRVLEERTDIAYSKVFFKTSASSQRTGIPISMPSAETARLSRKPTSGAASATPQNGSMTSSGMAMWRSMKSRHWVVSAKRISRALTGRWWNCKWACSLP